ncbi:TetR/AcrR family transcriptional regulator [Gilvimarinus sp. DA14]|uniref:TetR/AcrR family transcriptional regulator n=1 Tax=Gilvimarinus sp. DA14 TaxID=2956798 RepID=UPI0020B859E2|nr:TetR/AcrR family transcriptional regulator [Gilvimarinus sp. DA14]UTF60162.1 TetR/AcrR family transcriptional regulator [Gilvimarinus sp. DA14]
MATDYPKTESASAAAKSRYHHGNLRESLLSSALEYLQHDSLDNLSLRSLAKTLGVTATAVYSHFTDKTDLLIDLRTKGFEILSAHLRATLDTAPDATGEVKVRLLAHGYMAFARENPNLFDNLFAWTPERDRIKQECIEAGVDSIQLLRGAIVEMLQQHQLPSNEYATYVATLSSWSLIHGLTMLVKTGSIEGAIYCGHWPEEFGAAHPQSQARAFEHLLTIEVEGLKAAVAKITP